jgi:hypothetical protein
MLQWIKKFLIAIIFIECVIIAVLSVPRKVDENINLNGMVTDLKNGQFKINSPPVAVPAVGSYICNPGVGEKQFLLKLYRKRTKKGGLIEEYFVCTNALPVSDPMSTNWHAFCARWVPQVGGEHWFFCDRNLFLEYLQAKKVHL